MRALGKKLGVTVLDLNQHSITLGKALGGNKEKMYMYTASDKTHFCEYGAYELARANIEEIKAKVPELAKHLRDDHEAFDSSKPDPLDVLTRAKTPITEGGLIQVEPESSSSEEPEYSSSAEIAGPQSSSAAEGISSSAEGTEGTTAVESLTPRNAISGHIDGNTLLLEGIDGGAHDISVFDMQGHRIAEFHAMQGSELHITLRQGAYLVKVAQGNRTLGIFKAVRH